MLLLTPPLALQGKKLASLIFDQPFLEPYADKLAPVRCGGALLQVNWLPAPPMLLPRLRRAASPNPEATLPEKSS